MTGRFPMANSPFPPLAMANNERERLELLTHRLVHKALTDYDDYRQNGSKVDPRSWKLVRKCEQLAMYKRTEPSVYQPVHDRQPAKAIRTRAESTSIIEGSITQSRPRQKMPTLLQVGAIQGTLDEVMYGTVALDGPAMMLKTACTEDTLLDGETLCQLRGPSSTHPFRFLGVKWVVKGTPHIALAPIVRHRDLVFIEATGVLTREDNKERIGYHLMHSVQIPGYGPLDDKKIVRAQISSCLLYTETQGTVGSVDVFMKARFDPNGSVSESVATHSASLALMYSAKASVCAQNKKLLWMLHTSVDFPLQQRASSTSMARMRSCPICAKSFTMFSSVVNCESCSTAVCTACSVKKKLTFGDRRSKKVTSRSVVFCTSCLTHARRLDDFDAARQEVAATYIASTVKVHVDPVPAVHNCRRRDLPPVKQSSISDQAPNITRHHSEGVMPRKSVSPHRQRVNTWNTGDADLQTTSRWDKLELEFVSPKEVEEIEEDEIDEIKINESSLILVDPRDQRSCSYPTPHPVPERRESSQDEFMARIIALRNTAEDAYQTTRRTGQAQFEQRISAQSCAVRFDPDHEAYAV